MEKRYLPTLLTICGIILVLALLTSFQSCDLDREEERDDRPKLSLAETGVSRGEAVEAEEPYHVLRETRL